MLRIHDLSGLCVSGVLRSSESKGNACGTTWRLPESMEKEISCRGSPGLAVIGLCPWIPEERFGT